MKTVTIQIGNSDDKLTQLQWSNFVDKIDASIAAFKGQPHFSGGSDNAKPWQNYCWVFLLEDDPLITESFHRLLSVIRAKYQQDSVAWTEGKTLFV